MMFEAVFDFRHPQNSPAGADYQYELKGSVTIIDHNTLLVKCNGDRQYEITCIKNKLGTYEGSDRSVTIRLAQLSEYEYSGDWIEGDIHLLVLIDEA